MKQLLNRIKEHAGPNIIRRIEVPEWGTPAALDDTGREISPAVPLVIQYKMLTLDDLATIHDLDGSSWHKQAARIVAMKALDEKGERMFQLIDAIELRETAAPDVVTRVALAILGRVTVEDARKN